MERNLRYVSKNYRDPSKNDAEMNAIWKECVQGMNKKHTSVSKDVFASMDAYAWEATKGIYWCVCIEYIIKYVCKNHIQRYVSKECI
jgi:hypothetical protein